MVDYSNLRGAIGPYRDKYTVTVGTEDIEIPGGAMVQAGSAGNITYRTMDGESDQTETLTAGATVLGAGGIPVIIIAIRGTSTITSAVISR